jgi:hypothetical protein
MRSATPADPERLCPDLGVGVRRGAAVVAPVAHDDAQVVRLKVRMQGRHADCYMGSHQ